MKDRENTDLAANVLVTDDHIEHFRNHTEILRELSPVHLLYDGQQQSITLPEFLSHVLEFGVTETAQQYGVSRSKIKQCRIVAIEFTRGILDLKVAPIPLAGQFKTRLTYLAESYFDITCFEDLMGNARFQSELPHLTHLLGTSQISLVQLLQERFGWHMSKQEVHTLIKKTGISKDQISGVCEGGKIFLNFVYNSELSFEETRLSNFYFEQFLVEYDNSFFNDGQKDKDISISWTELLQAIYLAPVEWDDKGIDLWVLQYVHSVRNAYEMNQDDILGSIAHDMGISERQVRVSLARIRTILRREMYKLEEEKERI
jgi:hypothetical protein